jgi:hypothetical protein
MRQSRRVDWSGLDIELSKVLHASEQLTVPAPLPPSGSARAISRSVEVWVKDKAVVVLETSVASTDGTPLWTRRRSILSRSEGADSPASGGVDLGRGHGARVWEDLLGDWKASPRRGAVRPDEFR